MIELFSPKVGIYRGANDATLTQLEYIISPVLEGNPYKNVFFPALGLFGEASTGKTTCAKLIVDKLDVHCLEFRGDEITKPLTNILVEWTSKKKVTYSEEDGGICVDGKKIIIFIDEAHKLSPKIQNELLVLLEPNSDWYNAGITYIFATTDRSDLVYPLQTRLFPIVFEPYTKEDIANMLLLKYTKELDKDSAEQLAIFAKLIPRSAFKLAEVYLRNATEKLTKDTVVEAGKKVFNLDEDGLDRTDKRILLYLSNFKQNIQPFEELALEEYRKTVITLEHKTNLTASEHKKLNVAKFNIHMLSIKESKPEYSPKSLEDISMGCKLLDTGDLKVRINYMEQLGRLEKTSKGVRLKV